MDGEARQRRVVVIGGGVAGLAAAREVLVRRPGTEVVVLESGTEVGGKLRLGEVGGVVVDLGAEAMLARRPEGTGLVADVGLGDSLVHPATSAANVWTRGAVCPLPATLMGIPADPRAAAAAGILDAEAATRAERERDLPPPDLASDVAVGVLVAERLGAEVRDRLVEPLLGGVYAGRADEISLHAALPQLVSAVRACGGLLAAAAAALGGGQSATPGAPPPPVFAGVAGGVGRLPAAVAADIVARGGQVRRRSTARELRRVESGWQVVVGPTTEPEIVEADAVVVAVPAAPAARLLREAAPAAAAELSGIAYASMAVVTLAFDGASVDVELPGSGFLVPPVDGKTIKAATFSSGKWAWLAGDTVLLRCSIGRVGEEAVLQRPDGELVDVACAELAEAVGLVARPVDSAVTRWGGALPQYAVGHLDRVRRVHAAVGAAPGLAVCGAAYAGVGIPAVIASGAEAAARVVDALGERDTMGA